MIKTKNKKALVIFSGGQDSTTCLLKAIADYGKDNVEAITFFYGQRHGIEMERAKWIVDDLGIHQHVVDLSVMTTLTSNALMNDTQKIAFDKKDKYPNTFVDGRNAVFILMASIYAKSRGIHDIITGVCEVDFSGYPDCRDVFIKSMEVTINLAMDYQFVVLTPLMYLTKSEIWKMSDDLGFLEYVNEHSHTCYEGVEGGCGECPSCKLRENGLKEYLDWKEELNSKNKSHI